MTSELYKTANARTSFITVWQARELAVSVLDHVRNYELVQVLAEAHYG